MKRREFLIGASSLTAVAGMAGCSARRSPHRLLSAQEAEILSALCEQIIPADDTPGAAWAHVVKFIDRQLVYHYQREVPAYREAFAALARTSGDKTIKPFVALPFDEQTKTVALIENGELKADGWSADGQKAFFRLVRNHTMQGYYGDPRHGGNREMIGWRILGVPHPPVRGRDDYRFPKDAASASRPGGAA